jgi:Coenzyme PQQ synthesis protein D (PqqD)
MSGLLGQLGSSFFGGRKGKQVDRRRSLALKPLRNPKVDWSPDTSNDSGPITINIPLQRRPVPKSVLWFATKLARRKPPDTRKLLLDPVGSFVWRNADGSRTVRKLIWDLAAEYKLNRRDAEIALIEFLGKLSSRNLIGFANIPEV